MVRIINLAEKLSEEEMSKREGDLFNSDYYRVVLFFGVILAILAIVLNLILIPLYGINGSALATFIAIVVYNSIKVYFVKLAEVFINNSKPIVVIPYPNSVLVICI